MILGVKVSYDTQYGRVMIYNKYYNNNLIRMLNIDSGFESATYIDENKTNELVFNYTKYYDLMFKSKNDIKRYENLYGVRKDDMSYYDFVLDTGNLTPEEVLQKIKEEYYKWKEN